MTAILSAIIAGIVSLIVSLATIWIAVANIRSANQQTSATIGQEAERLKREFQLEFAAETAAKELLKSPRWELRSFKTIKRHLGGFDDEELRKLLVRAGAVRFYTVRNDEELWGLLSKNKHRLGLEDPEDDRSEFLQMIVKP